MPQEYARRDVVLVNLEPVEGHEQGATPVGKGSRLRPCVVVSELGPVKAAWPYPLYAIVPLTSQNKITGPLAPRFAARGKPIIMDSTALVMHVRSVDPVRIARSVGQVNDSEMAAIETGLRAFLSL